MSDLVLVREVGEYMDWAELDTRLPLLAKLILT